MDFFPDQLAKTGHEEMIQALARAGMDCIVLNTEESKHGAVETHEEAKRCAALFQKNRERIDGVILSLPNFGDERAIADTLRLARLDGKTKVPRRCRVVTFGRLDHVMRGLKDRRGQERPLSERYSRVRVFCRGCEGLDMRELS